ncbi:carbohydrate ABC transporter permease [Arthrobacter sp. zg-Y820]|uniref:carbohydrate ABC transporter permease n=1 Tax=unclassified Arthrobacter TaxID=235627 RepID=UPI001E547A1D|nr:MULTISPECIES: carbohydrate ABC transporter permease [unclassified Arthrobacter]MCC9195366.1 carbohydrate ABC transporter permease [Arthrobacter sp. zg-Y820]MDK1278225.1 carbohydrate ABC transporter permease [Arthrobacter sp. zg.Y820]MDK1361298.1 carbohydrate ABC transporter permease [Arthrobacter sp. zg-Y1219]WIB10106.1 carbohydrate ABC transporter permease [Arthrobacter sp. zg-Y820]
MRTRPNYIAGAAAALWLVIVALPLYVMIAASVQSRADFSANGPLSLPTNLTFENYLEVFRSGFGGYFLNTFIVTGGVVAIVLLVVPPLAYAIVRSQGRATTLVFRFFLLGLAIPVQAVIVPMFYLINTAGLYDTLLGIILPTAAFALPICTLILTGTMRDITPELYEAMSVDGASPTRTFLRLVLPLSKGGLSTIAVFSALQGWNGFLLPLILTQSESSRVVTLGLFNFQTQYGVNVPGILAAVTVSMIPVLLVYLFARRALVQGLMGVGGK